MYMATSPVLNVFHYNKANDDCGYYVKRGGRRGGNKKRGKRGRVCASFAIPLLSVLETATNPACRQLRGGKKRKEKKEK